MGYDSLRSMLKGMEIDAGRTQEKSAAGIIPLDIDILMYGDKKYKDEDWQREYNIRLLSSIGL